MPKGTLTYYVTKNPGADRIALVSLPLSLRDRLCTQTPLSVIGCRGRAQFSPCQLHDTRGPERGRSALFTVVSRHSAHFFLTQPNILIDGDGHACLADFGLASVAHGNNSIATHAHGYTARWTAPEILRGPQQVTREADVFSFGMVVMEVSSPRLSVGRIKAEGETFSLTFPALFTGFYRKTPAQRVDCSYGYDEVHGRRASCSPVRDGKTGFCGPGVEHDGRLLAARACSPANNGRSGRISSRMVRNSFL